MQPLMTSKMFWVLAGAMFGLNLAGCGGADEPDAVAAIQHAATDGDNSNPYTYCDAHGVAITYALNRLWDPANSQLNCSCVTTAGAYGTMQSKCVEKPNTCGYLYCTPVP